jgi:hypothetical protein
MKAHGGVEALLYILLMLAMNTVKLHYPYRKNSQYPLNRKLGRPPINL